LNLKFEIVWSCKYDCDRKMNDCFLIVMKLECNCVLKINCKKNQTLNLKENEVWHHAKKKPHDFLNKSFYLNFLPRVIFRNETLTRRIEESTKYNWTGLERIKKTHSSWCNTIQVEKFVKEFVIKKKLYYKIKRTKNLNVIKCSGLLLNFNCVMCFLLT
jgi:hypothetical protein